MSKTAEEVGLTLAAIHAALPVAVDPVRVKCSVPQAERGTLRVLLDGQLIGEWGYGVAGWMQFESAAWLGTEGQKVYRACKRVLK